MKKVLCVVGLIFVFLNPSTSGQEITEAQLEQARHDLQQALETIRSYHLAGHDPHDPSMATRLELLDHDGRVGMGVLVDSQFGDGGEPIGVLVRGVTPGGPADDAGLRAGDVINRIDGVSLTEGDGRPHEVLIRELAQREAGDVVMIDFLRDGRESTTSIELRKLQGYEFLFKPHPGADLELHDLGRLPSFGYAFPRGWVDLELVALTPGLGEYFGIDEGVLVVRAPHEETLGLRDGDVIVAIGDRVVKDPTHAMRILMSYEPDEVMTIDIMRHGRRQTITASVPEQRVGLLEEWSKVPSRRDE